MQFKEAREQWLSTLNGDDRHSIANQILMMLWDGAFYGMIRRTRAVAPQTRQGEVKLNALLCGFIDRSYLASQATAIRRLIDPPPKKNNKAKDVNSLQRVLHDIRDNIGLFRRKQMLEAEGRIYDFGPARDADYRYRTLNALGIAPDDEPPPPADWSLDDARHRQIDFLAAVHADRRGEQDRVRVEVVDRLEGYLKLRCSGVKHWVDKTVAHAATAYSRGTVSPDHLRLSLYKLYRAQRAVCRVYNAVAVYLLGTTSISGPPLPIYDFLEYLDEPFVRAAGMGQIEEAWNRHSRAASKWQADDQMLSR